PPGAARVPPVPVGPGPGRPRFRSHSAPGPATVRYVLAGGRGVVSWPCGSPNFSKGAGISAEKRSARRCPAGSAKLGDLPPPVGRSEEHTSELQSRENLVCRLLL